MKIKELHLRNIASIEQADIDFEKDLVDGVTGNPASVFLISGDTGAGKSVILDGISMALYKNTPRISGVANANRNEFTDAEGESIRVGSIEQYTRLGISDKEECYSEVAFTGNDGVEYKARLTLGMILGNTDKNTGKRPLKHRAPKWEIKVGAGDWTKDNVKGTILQAVGLSFEQFGRMAMLAQGQFAAFLTGDKKEREAILEQLTNTEHFTAYGAAIKSLFDKANSALKSAQTKYETESQHTLPQEKVNELTAGMKTLEEENAELDRKSTANDNALALVTAVEDNRSAADREGTAKAELEAMTASDEYKSMKTLVNDWDATSVERQRLSDLKDAESGLATAKTEEQRLMGTFNLLTADLGARRCALEAQGNPEKAVNDKQAEIDALTIERNALNPQATNDELGKLSTAKAELAAIATREGRISEEVKSSKELEDEIASDERKVKSDSEAFVILEKAYNEAKARADETASRYTTMSASVEDTLISLRKRLMDDHMDVCPLCGQKLEKISLEEEFRGSLTPLEVEKQAAASALSDAEKTKSAAQTELGRLTGAVQTKKNSLESKIKAIETARKKLGADAAKFGIDMEKPLVGQIVSVQKSLSDRESLLLASQKKAEELQVRITEAQEAKKPLEAALRKFNADTQVIKGIEATRGAILAMHPEWESEVKPKACENVNASTEWDSLYRSVSSNSASVDSYSKTIGTCNSILGKYYTESGKTEKDLIGISARKAELDPARAFIKNVDENLKSRTDAVAAAEKAICEALAKLGVAEEKEIPQKQALINAKDAFKAQNDDLVGRINVIRTQLEENSTNLALLAAAKSDLDKARATYDRWNLLNGFFGGTRFRTLVQTYILRPLLNNANIYLEKITDRYTLTCSEDNEQLSILVLDRYNKYQVRSVTVLSGGERFMISLALSLALSSLNHPDMNVNILFIDEGFGTLDEKSLDSVMETLEKLQEIAGQSERRVGIISHREELDERIPTQIQVKKRGEGRSRVEIKS